MKYEDFWAKHNITSRSGIFMFLIIYLLSIILLFKISIPVEIAKIILNTTGSIALISILAVVVGPNTLVKIVEIWKSKKDIE